MVMAGIKNYILLLCFWYYLNFVNIVFVKYIYIYVENIMLIFLPFFVLHFLYLGVLWIIF